MVTRFIYTENPNNISQIAFALYGISHFYFSTNILNFLKPNPSGAFAPKGLIIDTIANNNSFIIV